MGNLCDCFNSNNNSSEPTPKTPLLAGNSSYAAANHGPITSAPTGQSARTNKPEMSEKDFLTSLEVLSRVDLGAVSTVPSLDKTFQDHAKLYNDLYANFMELRQCLHDFKVPFEQETAGIPVIADCLELLAKRCGGAKLSGTRTKNSIQISYDRKEVSEKCQGVPEDVISILDTYNTANKLIKSVLDKSPQVKSSISIVLEEEQKLKREVTKADPDGKMGPEPLRITSENFTKLHKIPEYIDTLQRYTKKTFKEIVNGSKILFTDEE